MSLPERPLRNQAGDDVAGHQDKTSTDEANLSSLIEPNQELNSCGRPNAEDDPGNNKEDAPLDPKGEPEIDEATPSQEKATQKSHRRDTADYAAMLLVLNLSQILCPVHEDCDGSCTGQRHIFEPLVSEHWKMHAHQNPWPKLLDAGTHCRDASWLEDQHFDTFQYMPIDSRASIVRLLRIKDANFMDDVIECELYPVCLDDCPPFSALSYH